MPNRKLPPNEIIVAEYRSGMSCGEIAELHNVRPVTVQSLLSRIGEPRRTNAEAAKIRTDRGRTNPSRFWLGKKQSPEMVEKRVSKIRGENHYLWKGGLTKRDYRKVIKKEQCVNCDSRQNLGIHHKDDDHYNNVPENLEVLCVSCHLSLHKTAYWSAIKNGDVLPKSTGQSHWKPEDTKKWREENRDKYNAGQRAFRQKQKEVKK